MAATADALIETLYARFNARDVDGVLALLAPDVRWAKAMGGGYAEGHAGVRDYWTAQWAVVDPTVTPTAVTRDGPDAWRVQVRQVIRDLDGRILADDSDVVHLFTLRDERVTRFDVLETRGWDGAA